MKQGEDVPDWSSGEWQFAVKIYRSWLGELAVKILGGFGALKTSYVGLEGKKWEGKNVKL